MPDPTLSAYVLVRAVPYEGDEVLAVYAAEADAERAAFADRSSPCYDTEIRTVPFHEVGTAPVVPL